METTPCLDDAINRPWADDSLAANGRKVKENFDFWFDGTAARNPDGSPVVVRRGDSKAVDHFNGRREHGIFFALEAERAAYYGCVREYCLQVSKVLDLRDPYSTWRGGVGAEIIESIFEDYYNGYHHPDSGEEFQLQDIIFAIESGDLWRLDGTGGFTMDSWRSLQRMVDANGFDAMIVPDAGEGRGTGIDWVVFDSSRVKCISEHAGLFIADSKSLTDFESECELKKVQMAREKIFDSEISSRNRPHAAA